MKGVIVAAGLGQRLSPLTRHQPKPLVSVLERPLIDYTIEAFALTGFQELGVVLGHNSEIVQRYLQDSARYGIDIYCLQNGQYLRGNATSVYAARAFVGGEPFIVAMADHLVSPRILRELLVHSWTTHALCVDRQTRAGPALPDATKVLLAKDGRVQRIGKRLRRWHAVDVGVFLFWPRVFEHLSDLQRRSNRRCSITRLVRHMTALRDDLYACDVSGAFWLDVDTQDDLIFARRVLSVGLATAGLPQGQLVA
jgi:choline kinase